MNLQTLLTLLKEASVLSGHREFVVIGSLSILALESCFPVPEDMAMSNDIDCYTRNDPGRIFDVVPMLGENSPRHVESGHFIDAVSPALASLPEGWAPRMNRIESEGLIAGSWSPTTRHCPNTHAVRLVTADGSEPASAPAWCHSPRCDGACPASTSWTRRSGTGLTH